MPKILDWYRCNYACGYKSVDYDDVKRHEDTCILNPDYPYCYICPEKNSLNDEYDECKIYHEPIRICHEGLRYAYKCEKCIEEQRKRAEKINAEPIYIVNSQMYEFVADEEVKDD